MQKYRKHHGSSLLGCRGGDSATRELARLQGWRAINRQASLFGIGQASDQQAASVRNRPGERFSSPQVLGTNPASDLAGRASIRNRLGERFSRVRRSGGFG